MKGNVSGFAGMWEKQKAQESDSKVITHGQDHVDGVHSGGGATYEFFTLLRRKCIW